MGEGLGRRRVIRLSKRGLRGGGAERLRLWCRGMLWAGCDCESCAMKGDEAPGADAPSSPTSSTSPTPPRHPH